MREIKFRAWNKTANRYSKPFTLTCGVLNFTDDDGLGVVKSLTGELVEQFTGLKDKNGVDIYEGDIVSAEKNCMFHDGRINHLVEFTHDQFCVNGYSLFHSVNSFDAKVCGNIHQNPELMEQHQ